MNRNKNFYAVILAGGSGTRFWPKSRTARPKQFLDMTGQGSLFRQTVKRISSAVQRDHIFVVTNQRYRRLVREQAGARRIPPANILLEPAAKNTAPAICWAASRIYRKNPRAVMAVLPSDHLIGNNSLFLKALQKAAGLAGRDYLVTFGIPPTRPETGYGYLQTRTVPEGKSRILRVRRFIEKPSLDKAKRFVRSKNYFWNSGMFVWKAEVILRAFQEHQPVIFNLIGQNASQAVINKIWTKLPSVSVDYGILEKAGNVAAVAARNIGWSDLGSWEALTEVLPKDRLGNTIRGDVIAAGCRDMAVFGADRLVAVIGLEEVVVVDSPDALLVCRRDKSQKVREVVGVLQEIDRAKI